MDGELLFASAQQLQQIGRFRYNAGKHDLLNDIVDKEDRNTLDPCQVQLLRNVIAQPCGLYCYDADDVINTESGSVCCCFAHIVKFMAMSQWEAACTELDKNLHARLKAPIVSEDMNLHQVLACIEAEGQRVKPSPKWEKAFTWLTLALPCVCSTHVSQAQLPTEYQGVIEEVKLAAKTFHELEGFHLRPCQLAAILLNAYGVKTGTKLLIEMKTGEGKTFVCVVSACVISKLFEDGPAVILTSSVDRAMDDKKSTDDFVKKYLDKESILVSDLKPGSNSGAGLVAYGQVSDVQRIVVDTLLENKPKELYAFLKKCSFFLDEADHVLVEQAESLLYIASPCPSYQALHSLSFHIQYRLDYDADFIRDNVKHRSAVQDKAKSLSERILIHISKHEHSQGAEYPVIIDVDVFVASIASGALSSRFKANGKEYVIEVTTDDDHPGTIANVPKITIMDIPTGVESDGTRWTTEAPSIEAASGLPISGSDPLAFYSAFPYLLQKVRWYGGITGTVGAAHTLRYYGETFDIWSTFRIPRNKRTTMYQLPTVVADNKERQIANICDSVMRWVQEQSGVPAKGPCLIVAESIEDAQQIEKALAERGHAVMEAEVLDAGTNKDGKEAKVTWKINEPTLNTSASRNIAHVFPFYRREHCIMETFPDCAVIVASNKGGRGLDLKLDHDLCPEVNGQRCFLDHFQSALDTKMNSVLFVILTDVLPDRQDEQARGRCGRSGKAGVLQYQLAKKNEDTDPSDPETVYLERKLNKSTTEKNDLGAKCNRIGQHRFDGFVLDTFCEYLPTFVDEWVLKLFPFLRNHNPKKNTSNSPDDKKSGRETDSDPQDATGDGDDQSILPLVPIVRKWLTEYVTEAWAYWKGFGGSRRQPGNFLKYFETRMGLANPEDLPPAIDEPNALKRFELRFFRFAYVLRLSGEALRTFAEALLGGEHDLQVLGLCRNVLKRASSKTNCAGGESLKLPPDNDDWQPEFSGNAAMLFARLSSPDNVGEGLRRAIDAINARIIQFQSDSDMTQKPHPEQLPTSSAPTYYLVQRAEIVNQLEHRKKSLENHAKQPSALTLKHISTALKDPNNDFLAYQLGYGWCEVMFEWYVDEPFAEPLEATKQWRKFLEQEAKTLGASSSSSSTNGGTGTGSAQVRTKEQLSKLEQRGTSITARLESELKTREEANSHGTTGAPVVDQWKDVTPSAEDIASSKQSIWQVMSACISFVWAWLVTQFTAPVRRYKDHSQSGGGDDYQHHQHEEDQRRKNNPIWQHVHSIIRDQQMKQTLVTGGLVSGYLGGDADNIVNIVNELGVFHRHSDLYQEDVDVRTNGETAQDHNRADLMNQAKEEAAEPAHFRDPNMSKEDKYLISKTLEALKKMASEKELEGFDNRLHQMLEAIAKYNDFAQEGQVDEQTAENMHAAMKELWQSTLRFALEHGKDIEDLTTPLSNYNIAKSASPFIEKTKEVITTVTETVSKTVSKVVEVVKEIASKVWGFFKWVWRTVKKFVNKVIEVVEQIPIVREVVTFVKETVVNPVYEAAKNFFDSAKETLLTSLNNLSSAMKALAEAVCSSVTKLGKAVGKAWDWVKETSFWQTLSSWFMTGLSWVTSALYSVFDMLMPILAATWSALTLVWKALSWAYRKLQPYLQLILGPIVAMLMRTVWNLLNRMYEYLMYWWQGRGDILQDHIWGNFLFDIVDVRKGITRQRMKLRAALQRVWASSWLQWFLDDSISLGVDIDSREHVQMRQERAHQDHLRRQNEEKKQTGMLFAGAGVLLSTCILAGVFFSGGALLLPAIGLITAVVSALLQYVSMNVEEDRTISEEDKTTMQSLISIAQAVVLIGSILCGCFINAGDSVVAAAEVAAGAAMKYIGPALRQFSTWLQKLLETARVRQRANALLQQIDKLLRLFGIGAIVILMNIHDSLLGMLSTTFEVVSSGMKLAENFVKEKIQNVRRKKNQQEQDQTQQQQQQEEEEEEEEEKDNKGEHRTTVRNQKALQTLVRTDGWTLEKIDILLGASADANSKSELERLIQGSSTTCTFAKEGTEPFHVTLEMDKSTGKVDVNLSRELSENEMHLFGFTDTSPSVEELEKLFHEQGDVVVSNTKETWKGATQFNKDGQKVKEEQSHICPKGEVHTTYSPKSGKLIVTVQPNGDPQPERMILELQGVDDLTKAIRGDITSQHIDMLAEFLGLPNDTVEVLIESELQDLVDLAKENQQLHQQQRQEEKDHLTKRTKSNVVHEGMVGAWQWAQQVAQHYCAPFFTLVYTIGGYVKDALNWIGATRLGEWLTNIAVQMYDTLQSVARSVLSHVTSWVSRVFELEDNTDEAIASAPHTDESDPKMVAVQKLFVALLPIDVESSDSDTDSETPNQDQQQSLNSKLAEGILGRFRSHAGAGDAGFGRAAEMLVAQLLKGETHTMSEQEKADLQRNVEKHGPAKALFDVLSKLSVQQKSTTPISTAASTARTPPSAGAALYESMVSTNAGYSRQHMVFKNAEEFCLDNVPDEIKHFAAHLGVPEDAIHQLVSSESLQAKVTKFIRDGDQKGFVEFVQHFLKAPLPDQFADVPVRNEEEARLITAKLDVVCTQAWSQYTDETVAKTTHELITLMSVSVHNLGVEGPVPSQGDTTGSGNGFNGFTVVPTTQEEATQTESRDTHRTDSATADANDNANAPTVELVLEAATASEYIYNACNAEHGKYSWERLESTIPDGWTVERDADNKPLANQDGAILRSPSGRLIAVASGSRFTSFRGWADAFQDGYRFVRVNVPNQLIQFWNSMIRSLSLQPWIPEISKLHTDESWSRSTHVQDLINRSPEPVTLVTGHSLGGGVAEHAGHLLNIPVVVFNAPNFDHHAGVRDDTLRIRSAWDPVSWVAGAHPRSDISFPVPGIDQHGMVALRQYLEKHPESLNEKLQELNNLRH